MPWRLVLLWLCIALLPLRGWALGLPPGALAHGAIHGQLHAATAAMQAPCHDAPATFESPRQAPHHGHGAAQGLKAAHDPAPACPAPGGPDLQTEHGSCAFCDVCHGAAALPPLARSGFEPLLPAAPPAWVPRPAGRLAVHELFRPPRA